MNQTYFLGEGYYIKHCDTAYRSCIMDLKQMLEESKGNGHAESYNFFGHNMPLLQSL